MNQMSVSHPAQTLGQLEVRPILHPQGCRSYVIADPKSEQAMVLDVHLDLVAEIAALISKEGWKLKFVMDSHTHADHPSGAAALVEKCGGQRIAHIKAGHNGVVLHPEDGEVITLGELPLTIRHAPGHTPDHLVLLSDKALFSGDSIFIGAVARTDFLGGDAGQLFDTIQSLLEDLDDEVILFPGHDYGGRVQSTIGVEKRQNPWLAIQDRDEFSQKLKQNPPARPANMDALLRFNKQGQDFAASIQVDQLQEQIAAGGAGSIIDVRTGVEFDGEHIEGSRLIPLDQIEGRLDEVRATPAPRLLLCRTDRRARLVAKTLSAHDIEAISVVVGGIEAFAQSGGELIRGKAVMGLERQVRILAGALVFIGAVLAYFVHEAFLILPSFIGAGLVFAGISDTCGMGMMLAKMPWNRSQSESCSTAAGGCAASVPSACAAGIPDESQAKN